MATKNVYNNMVQRCNNKNSPAYTNYGARGVTVCLRWLGKDGFVNFSEDMGEHQQNLSLDRIDNNKGYCKENCRWADKVTQNNNTRRNHLFNGKTLTQWAQILNIKRSCLAQRYYVYGWDITKTLTQSPKQIMVVSK